MLLVEEIFENAKNAPVTKLFTNFKTFKIAFSKELKDAMNYTKAANSAYKKGQLDVAMSNYKNALPIWNSCIRELNSVPEVTIGQWSTANWFMFVPFVNYVLLLIVIYQAADIHDSADGYASGTGKYGSPELSKKLNEAMTSKAISKRVFMEALVFCQDFTEQRIKDCKNGVRPSFEATIVIQESFIDAVIECCDNIQQNDI